MSVLSVAVCSLLVFTAWVSITVAWPGVTVSDPARSETAGLIATIDVTLVVIVPAVALVLLQVLSPLSSQALRVVVGGPIVPVLFVALVLGVIVPVWVDASPSIVGIRVAFAGLGVTIASVILSVVLALRRATPQSVADHWTRRAFRPLGRAVESRPPSRHLPELTEVLAELAGANLPNRTHQRVLKTWALVVMTRAEIEPSEEIVRAVEDLAATGLPRAPARLQNHIVAALATIGIARCRDTQVHASVIRALRELAVRARTNGDHNLGHDVLDAAVDIDIARLTTLLPDQRHPTLTRRDSAHLAAIDESEPPFPSPPGVSLSRDFYPPVYQDAEPTDPSPSVGDTATVGARTYGRVQRVLVRYWPNGSSARGLSKVDVQAIVMRCDMSAQGILAIANKLSTASTTGPTAGNEPPQKDQHASSAAYDLMHDSVVRLSAVLAAPQPGSKWPGGWQGVAALDRDLRRIGRLALALYQKHRYPPGAVEEALETVAVQLSAEARQTHNLPVDRTGWRTAHTPDPTHPGITVAKTLANLMVAAFTAGFDRRALLTGRRLLAATTMAVRDGDVTAAQGYAEALNHALNKITRKSDNTLIAYQRRDSILLAGLIAEYQPLLEAIGDGADQALDSLGETVHYLPWRTRSNPWRLASLAWRARLAAVGWPVPMPGVSRVDWSAPPAAPMPLRTGLVEHAESELRLHLGAQDPAYPAALLTLLWANAAVNAQYGESAAGARLCDVVREVLHQYDTAYAKRPAQRPAADEGEEPPGVRPLDPQLRRLADAAARWTRRRSPRAPAKIPRSLDRRGLPQRIQELLDKPDTPNWRYHGLITADDANLVLVEEPDGSRRLLRDSEAGARGQFAWGYGGNGPHTLAKVLTDDILADLARCPHCLGAAPCGAGPVTCSACADTGRIREWTLIVDRLVERVISRLPDQAGQPSMLPDAVWMVTRAELLAAVCRRRRD